MPLEDGDAPPLPVCEMLSNDHTVPPITFWLMQFTLHLSKYTQIKIHQVETDYSWALIQSVMLAFNKEHISSYLNRAYKFCIGQKSWAEMKSHTVLHICSAHILKAVRQAICRQTDDKGLRDFATFAFTRLQNASNMTESTIVFRALCALLTTPQNTKLVKESLCVLESVISRSKDWEKCDSEDRRHAACNDWSKACGSKCNKIFNRQNQTGKGQRVKTGISEAGQRRKQYQAKVGVTGTGSEFQGRAVRGQTQR